jgi:hypothetical protein
VHVTPAAEVGGGPFRQIAFRRRGAEMLQGGGGDGIAGVQAVEGGEQAQQEKQPLQIQQAGIAVEVALLGAVAVESIADLPIELLQPLQQLSGLTLPRRWIEGDDRGETLRPARAKLAMAKRMMTIADHGCGHGPIPPGGPLQVGGQGGGEPLANPFNRRWEGEHLGVMEAPGAAGVGAIDDHRDGGRHRLLQPARTC